MEIRVMKNQERNKWYNRSRYESRIIIGTLNIGVNRYEYSNQYFIDYYDIKNADVRGRFDLNDSINKLKDAKIKAVECAVKYKNSIEFIKEVA